MIDTGVAQAVGTLGGITGGYHDKVQQIVQQAAENQAKQRAIQAAAQAQVAAQRQQDAYTQALTSQQAKIGALQGQIAAMPSRNSGGGGGTYGNTPASPGNAGNPGSMSAKAAQHLGQQMAAQYGWSGAQWNALNNVEMREAGWNANAVNPNGGAYGIPQALGHGHPFNLGDAPAQIKWMLDYIKSRYGSPQAAWNHELQVGWY